MVRIRGEPLKPKSQIKLSSLVAGKYVTINKIKYIQVTNWTYEEFQPWLQCDFMPPRDRTSATCLNVDSC